jgi:hypothetical protein
MREDIFLGYPSSSLVVALALQNISRFEEEEEEEEW